MEKGKHGDISSARRYRGSICRLSTPAFCHIDVIVLVICIAFAVSIFLFVLRTSTSEDPLEPAAGERCTPEAAATTPPRFTPYSAETSEFTPYSEYNEGADNTAVSLCR